MKDRHVALLRGINVGGKNKLPMVELAALFAAAGASEVKTYIQSGNVLFRASGAVAKKLPSDVAGAIEKKFGFRSPVVLRTADELRTVLEHNPFETVENVHVAFLADLPGATAVKALDPKRSPPDVFAVRGREVFLLLPNGVGRTKLTNAYFDSKLSTVSTWRNWNTVQKLNELLAG